MSERAPLPETLHDLARGPVLLLAPHPDDELLGCGLTCHRHHLQGDPVHVVVAYDGALGNKGSEGTARAEFVRTRQQETRAACRVLGFDSVERWNQHEHRVSRRALESRSDSAGELR